VEKGYIEVKEIEEKGVGLIQRFGERKREERRKILKA